MIGDEFSFDSVFIAGEMVWHSINHYMPSPLTVLEHPWIQWCVVLPRDISGPEFDPIRQRRCRRPACARHAHGAQPHGVVPPCRRVGGGVRGRVPAHPGPSSRR